MFQNNNSAAARRLSFKCLQASRSRNIVAIIAIALTTILFTTVFTVGHGALYSVKQQMQRQMGTKFDATYEFLNEQQFLKIKSHPSFQNIGERQYLALAENDELIKRLVEIDYGNEVETEGKYSAPTTGRMPQSIDEVAVNTVVLDLLGVPHEIGTKFPLYFNVDGEQKQRSVMLSGYWEGDVDDSLYYIWVSKSFIDRELEGILLPESGYAGAGSYYVDADFSNHLNLQEKIYQVLRDSGYDLNAVMGDPLYINASINQIYEAGTSVDISVIFVVAILLALILISGYLIIYNIFQISVVKDIRLYGQLKTLGTSPRQLHIIVRRQGFLLSTVGIPIGLLVGYLLGRALVPVVMTTSNYAGIMPPPNIFVFIGSAVFALLTVLVSFRKPAKTAASISPIEAMRYSGVETTNRKHKKSQGGAKIVRMAASNLIRNPRKTAVVLLSLSLSVVLLNSVLTYTDSFQLQKFIERDVVTDFIVSDARYGRGDPLAAQSGISENVISTLQEQSTFEDGGSVYYHTSSGELNKLFARITNQNGIQTAEEDIPEMQFYGMDKFPFALLDVIDGDLNWEKFNTGKYVIELATYNDYHKVDMEDYIFHPGDKITLECDDVKKEYEVLARVACKTKMTSKIGMGSDTSLAVSSSEFLNCFSSRLPLLYLFNVDKSGFASMDSFLNDYTNQTESALKYTSKQSVEDNFYELKQTYNAVGIVLAAIFAMIGLLNFINVITTGILSRQKEFAVMQSIGMTKRQLRKMLVLEGLWYGVLAVILSLAISSATSMFAVQSLANSMWYSIYHFTLVPALIVTPLYLLAGVLVPFAAVRIINKGSVVQQLRNAE